MNADKSRTQYPTRFQMPEGAPIPLKGHKSSASKAVRRSLHLPLAEQIAAAELAALTALTNPAGTAQEADVNQEWAAFWSTRSALLKAMASI